MEVGGSYAARGVFTALLNLTVKNLVIIQHRSAP